MDIRLCDNTSWIFSRKAFNIYRDCMYLPTYHKYIAEIEDFLKSTTGKVYLCCKENKVVGIIMIRLFCDQSAEIKGIAVSPKHRNCGVGKLLITAVKKSEGLKTLVAQTDEDAVGFYRNCGFQVETEMKEYPNGIILRYNCIL